TRSKRDWSSDVCSSDLMLAGVLLGAYGRNRVGALVRDRLLSRLAALPCPCPTLIDGRMRPSEWVRTADSFRKTDYEHHGLGKYEIGRASCRERVEIWAV